jgi:hypothetical protein
MDTFFAFFLSYYLNLFDTVPHTAACVGIMLRSTSKRIRTEFDVLYNQERWWQLIHERFIPNIVGLPSDLKTAYYLKMLRKYFIPLGSLCPIKSLLKILTPLLKMNPDGTRREKEEFISFGEVEFAGTAEGRVHLLAVVDALKTNVLVRECDEEIVEAIRNVIRYSFCVKPHCAIGLGVGNDSSSQLTGEFSKWRC